MKELIKQDINFLEYNMWFQDEVLANKTTNGYIWEDREGYFYKCGYKLPEKVDFIFLLWLLKQSQDEGWKEEIEFTRYNILKGCDIPVSKPKYDRVVDSFKRWFNVKIQYEGTFYDGKSYQSINFGIIEMWSIEKETKKIKIRFSPEWLLKIKESNFFKMINFEDIKKLQSPLETRLYEILVKSFQGRNIWEIGIMKLAQKIPMNEKYPAHVIPKIESTVGKINGHLDKIGKHSGLKVKVSVRDRERGEGIFVFEKIDEIKIDNAINSNTVIENILIDNIELNDTDNDKISKLNNIKQKKIIEPTIQTDEYKKLLELLPEIEREKELTKKIILHYLKNKDFDYVRSSILYTNEYNKIKKSYLAYLKKSLVDDYGLEIRDTEQAKKKVSGKKRNEDKEQLKKREDDINELKQQKENRIKAKEYMDSLNDEDKEMLKKICIEFMSEEDIKSPFFSSLLESNKVEYICKHILDK